MQKSYILVIDSGVGGVSIIKNLIKKLPNENFIYFADNKNSPYGNKSKRFLEHNIIKILENFFQNYNIKLVVFACNTITATTIKKSRKTFKNIKFVGTEPPIKQVNKTEETLVLATKQTLKYCKILKKYKNNKKFTFIALNNVASMLDNNFFKRKELKEELFKQIKLKNYKNIVLGCTHYYFLEKEIKNVLNNKNIKFYNSILGVTNRVLNIITKTENKDGEIKIVLSKNDNNLLDTINNLIKSV